MELPKYAVPESLLSPPPLSTSRGDHTLQDPVEKIDDKGRHSKVRSKRKRTDDKSTSLNSVLGRIGPPQYTVPEYLISPQSMYSSLRGLTFQTPLNDIIDPDRHDNPITSSQPEPGIPVHARSESMCLALSTHFETNDRSLLPPSKNSKQSEELLRTMTPPRQSLDESPNLAFQTAVKDLSMKNECFLGISQDTFFPTPAMTEPWGEAPTPNLSWDSGPGLPFLLDGDVSLAEPDAVVAGAVPENFELLSGKGASDTHSTVNMAVSLPKGDSQLNATALTEPRLSHVLKAVAAAGFESLDDAVVAYYVDFPKDDERLRQAQRLNRIRRLPVLLKELQLAAQGWGQWQRRSFQEQIIKSTEDIVVAELEDYFAARRPNHYNSTCSTEQPCQACKHKARDETDIEAELPNTWTLLTSLSTRCNAIALKDGQTDVPKLISKFLAAVTDLGA